MANSFTGLVSDIYAAIDTVSRNRVGFLGSVRMDSRLEQLTEDNSCKVPITAPQAARNIHKGLAMSSASDRNTGFVEVEITKQREVAFNYTGEESASLDAGPGYANIRRQEMVQALNTLVTEMESDLASEVATNVSRTVATGSNEPFAESDGKQTQMAQARKILAENGAPDMDRCMVFSLDGAAQFMGNSINLLRADASGDSSLLRMGSLSQQVLGFQLAESSQTPVHAKTTQSGFLVKGAVAKGATDIVVDTGTGAIVAGDVVQFAGDPNNYVVDSIPVALSGSAPAITGTIRLRKPGLLQNVGNNAAITFQTPTGGFIPNIALYKGAAVFVNRLPFDPPGGDLAQRVGMQYTVQDPVSGLVFGFYEYPGVGMNQWVVKSCWGQKTIREEYIAAVHKG